ncbi:MAG TPA: hypothetical protein VFV71_02345 [Burkholderiales bacterium]|nr:hypothetical protein [Burkholderiales bacterium]
MNLERITVEFHAEEDRLMVRVFFDGKAEVQFWLTRRLVSRMWPVLIQMAQARPEIQVQANPEVRKAMLGMQHEKALQEVKFTKAAAQEPQREHPLGSTPMLVSKVRARRNDRGQTVLSLQPQHGNGVDLALGDTLLHGLMKLVQDTAIKAEWGLTLAVPAFAHTPSEEDAGRTVN